MGLKENDEVEINVNNGKMVIKKPNQHTKIYKKDWKRFTKSHSMKFM
ncbi:MAG: hypothetical protein ACLTX3_08480 [Lachnospiraceae bacterium]